MHRELFPFSSKQLSLVFCFVWFVYSVSECLFLFILQRISLRDVLGFLSLVYFSYGFCVECLLHLSNACYVDLFPPSSNNLVWVFLWVCFVSSTKWLRVILVCCSISVFFLRAFLVCLYSLSTSRVPGEKRQLLHIFALEKFRCANVNKGDANICRRGLICLFVYRLLYSLHFLYFPGGV